MEFSKQLIKFPRVLEQIYNKKAAKSILAFSVSKFKSEFKSEFRDEVIFLPSYGFCKSIFVYNPNFEISISSRFSFYILITDPKYSSYIMPDLTSMKGNAIVANVGKEYFFDVNIRILKICIEVDTTTFKTCVDDRIQNVFLPTLGCIPPWLSDRNQCNGHYPFNFTDDTKYSENYVTPAQTVKNIEEEHMCKKLCVFTTTEPRLRYLKELSSNKRTTAHISFQKEVSVTEKIPDYDFFKFVIDIGSSLGLRLGLSILGLWDLLTDTIQWLRSSKLSKMLCK